MGKATRIGIYIILTIFLLMAVVLNSQWKHFVKTHATNKFKIDSLTTKIYEIQSIVQDIRLQYDDISNLNSSLTFTKISSGELIKLSRLDSAFENLILPFDSVGLDSLSQNEAIYKNEKAFSQNTKDSITRYKNTDVTALITTGLSKSEKDLTLDLTEITVQSTSDYFQNVKSLIIAENDLNINVDYFSSHTDMIVNESQVKKGTYLVQGFFNSIPELKTYQELLYSKYKMHTAYAYIKEYEKFFIYEYYIESSARFTSDPNSIKKRPSHSFSLYLTDGINGKLQKKNGKTRLQAKSCTVIVDCGDGSYISCTSDLNDCERDPFGGTVTCDGITTYCN